jgi:hypothetical protein
MIRFRVCVTNSKYRAPSYLKSKFLAKLFASKLSILVKYLARIPRSINIRTKGWVSRTADCGFGQQQALACSRLCNMSDYCRGALADKNVHSQGRGEGRERRGDRHDIAVQPSRSRPDLSVCGKPRIELMLTYDIGLRGQSTLVLCPTASSANDCPHVWRS